MNSKNRDKTTFSHKYTQQLIAIDLIILFVMKTSINKSMCAHDGTTFFEKNWMRNERWMYKKLRRHAIRDGFFSYFSIL